MILQRVSYQVFEHELAGDWGTDQSDWHQLDGQLVLTFTDERALFVSWDSEPVRYCIQKKLLSFFNSDALKEVDMTVHPFWHPFIERELRVSYVDDAHQVLMLNQGEPSLFISSQYDDGSFMGDCVRIAQWSPL